MENISMNSALLKSTVLLSLFGTSCSVKENKKEEQKPHPNIIWIVSEDNSPLIGCYGDTNARTPNIDKLASEGIIYDNAFANAPVSAPSRSTLVTGMFANCLGTHHMRCKNPVPDFVHFFPKYLKDEGYFTSNRIKKDYNTFDQDSVWDVDSWWNWEEALEGIGDNQPFFIQYNTWMSHEDKVQSKTRRDEYWKGTLSAYGYPDSVESPFEFEEFVPGSIPHPPYHPDILEVDEDWADYYSCIERMDAEVGLIMAQLEKDSLLDNTIVFYFSDHGGVVVRSKRFTYESGLKVPFIIRFPDKYQYLAPGKPGTRTDRVISFIDLPPTLLNLLGIPIPDYMQGNPFLGKDSKKESEYAYGFRGRMDEAYDFSVTIRDKNFRYIKNYMPNRIWGQHISFLWKARVPSAWEKAFKDGTCDDIQNRFWQQKPVEELYEIASDPHNVNNLAKNPDYTKDLERMRTACKTWIFDIKEKSFMPEGDMVSRSKGSTPYELMDDKDFPFDMVVETAELAIEGNPENLPVLIKRLHHEESSVRYWATVGCSILGKQSEPAKDVLQDMVNDPSIDVGIAAAEAMKNLGEEKMTIDFLKSILLKKPDENDKGELYYYHLHALNVITLFDNINQNSISMLKEYSEKKDIPGYNRNIAAYIVEINQ